MASRKIFTEVFRASHVHLKEKFSFEAGKEPKFRLQAMFSKSGQHTIQKTGINFVSNDQIIRQAILEVVKEEWNVDSTIEDLKVMTGVQFPPVFHDGDLKLQKDSNGNPIPNQYDPLTKGFTILSVTSDVVVGTCGPDLVEIDPATIYSGCWCRAELEVSAYVSKANARIINVSLVNVQMAYHDESFSGRGPTLPASQAFSGMAITNSDIQAGHGQVMTPVNQTPNTPTPPAAPNTPTPPAAPNTPNTPTPPAKPAEPVYVHTCTEFDEATYRADPAWTTEVLVAQGKGKMETPAPVAPNTPPVTTPPAAPATGTPTLPATPTVGKPTPMPPATPTTGNVIMNADSPYTYDELKNNGWNDEQIITAGYAKQNFTNPA